MEEYHTFTPSASVHWLVTSDLPGTSHRFDLFLVILESMPIKPILSLRVSSWRFQGAHCLAGPGHLVFQLPAQLLCYPIECMHLACSTQRSFADRVVDPLMKVQTHESKGCRSVHFWILLANIGKDCSTSVSRSKTTCSCISASFVPQVMVQHSLSFPLVEIVYWYTLRVSVAIVQRPLLVPLCSHSEGTAGGCDQTTWKTSSCRCIGGMVSQ